MASGLDGICMVKLRIPERQLHEVGLLELTICCYKGSALGSDLPGSLNLMSIVVDTGDASTTEAADLASRATHSAAKIKDLQAALN
jgi:hypothetical protein